MYIFVKIILITLFFVNITNASYCYNMEQKYQPIHRYVSCNDIKKDVFLYWGNDPSRAASALFAVFLRYRLGYQNVHLKEGPLKLQDLATHVPNVITRTYDEVILVLATSWEPISPLKSIPNNQTKFGITRPRLMELGASQIPVVQRLHLYMSGEFRYNKLCTNANTWIFYTNITALTHCGFINKHSNNHVEKNASIYYIKDSNNGDIISKLEKRVNASSQYLQFRSINRTNLFKLLKENNKSFLYLDYDIWFEYSNVSMVQLPPCIPTVGTYMCQQELDNGISMRVADISTLEEYAPKLLQVAQNFIPSPKSLREILKLEDNGTSSIEEAACKYALDNKIELKYLYEKYNNNRPLYEILVFKKQREPLSDLFFKKFTIYEMQNEVEILNAALAIVIYNSTVHSIKSTINDYMQRTISQRLLGIVVDSDNNAEVARNIDGVNLPIILYGPSEIEAKLTKSIWLSTGRSLHVILALQTFMLKMNWERIAIISEQTPMAKSFVNDLTTHLKNVREDERFAFRDHILKPQLLHQDAKNLLQELKDTENARIILVNTNSTDALTLLSVAKTLNMNEKNRYVWILREWQPDNLTFDIRHVTISFWCQSKNNLGDSDGRRDIRYRMDTFFSGYKRWPAKATAVIDAMLTLIHGFTKVLLKYPETLNDVHSQLALRQFENSLHSTSIRGINHNLTYKNRSIEETLVYLEEWHGDTSTLLARWRVNTTALKVYSDFELPNEYAKYATFNDGATRCNSRDKYLPVCHEMTIALSIIFLALLLLVLMVLYHAFKRYQENCVKKIMCELIRKRQQCAVLVSGHIIERSALTLGQELGTGRFGKVRVAQLKMRGRKPRRVAVKTLCDENKAIDIMGEACALAALDHNYIINLIGVCLDKNTALLVMEYALFGDLLQYLQNRWYLAEGASVADEIEELITNVDNVHDEAIHVSPRALTRLAHQAASALAYLCQQGIVHRDIRASNCLIDERRSLKLADFGLARKLKVTEGDDEVKYKTFRCGVFPVLWMAPECLNHGIFSTASDIWALGLLIFEIVTLGARPYGEMSPKAVYNFVANGGQPSMPYDATSQTVALAQLCWQRKPEERPSAADIEGYLAEHSCALRPAFECKLPGIPDNGLDDSPPDQLLMI